MSSMTQEMLDVCSPERRGELRRLFDEYPFEQMSREYSVTENCGGITFPDSSIYVYRTDDPGWNLHIYLHEVAHATLIRAGHPRGFDHCDDFLRICRELQARFGVLSYVNTRVHIYDQQDAAVKRPMQSVSNAAKAAAMAIEYDPTSRAMYAAVEATQADMRQTVRIGIFGVGAAVIALAAVIAPWARILAWLDGDGVRLVGGAMLIAYLWLNLR